MGQAPSDFCIVQSLDEKGVFRSITSVGPTYQDPYDNRYPPRIFMNPSLARTARKHWCRANDDVESNWEIIPVTVERRTK